MTDQFLNFVQKYLVVTDAKCSRHCDWRARFVSIDQTGSRIVGAYVCPQNYVSRIVYFDEKPDPVWFEKFLVERIGKINQRDIRAATRHGWELGGNAETEIGTSKGMTQYYWTPYPLTDEEKKHGVFLCAKEDGGCGKLYSKLKSDESKLCADCGGR